MPANADKLIRFGLSAHCPVRRIACVALLLGALGGCSGGGGGGSDGSTGTAPVANPDTYPTATGQLTLSVASPGVLVNDTGSSLTAQLVSSPSSAQSFALSPDGSFTYVHSSTSAATTDSFTYKAQNGTTSSSPTTVTINVTPPVAAPDTFAVTTLPGSVAGNVLFNDNPSSGLTAELVTAPASCTGCPSSFALSSDGSFTYTHNNGNAQPSDSFTYRAKAGAIASNTVTVTININQPPAATNGCYIIQDDTPPTITSWPVDLTQRVSDPNASDTFTYEIESLPASGTIAGCSTAPCTLSNGILTYVPNNNATGRRGMDKLTFHVTDAGGQASSTRAAWILNNGKVRIMPLGDSITAGIWTDSIPVSADRVGYRKELYEGLVAAGYPVDFVGQYSDGSGTGLADTDHEGLPGLTACDLGGAPNPPCPARVNDDVIMRLDNRPADIVLLHIGTNNFSTSSFPVESILDRADTWEGNNHPVWMFVAKIIDDSGAINGDLDVPTFNTNVANMVNGRPTDMVRLVDQHSVVNQTIDDTDPYVDGEMYDDLHPNPSGYTDMASRWLTDLLSSGVLPTCQ